MPSNGGTGPNPGRTLSKSFAESLNRLQIPPGWQVDYTTLVARHLSTPSIAGYKNLATAWISALQAGSVGDGVDRRSFHGRLDRAKEIDRGFRWRLLNRVRSRDRDWLCKATTI